MKSSQGNWDENTSPSNDPWAPISTNGHQGNENTFATTFNPFINMPMMMEKRMKTSEEHIASLEAKLKKIKGGTKREPTGRDLLKSLCEVRNDAVRHMPDYSEAFIEETIDGEESALTQIQRKLHPEKQAINADELLHLVENDILGKTVCEMNDQNESEVTEQSGNDVQTENT